MTAISEGLTHLEVQRLYGDALRTWSQLRVTHASSAREVLDARALVEQLEQHLREYPAESRR